MAVLVLDEHDVAFAELIGRKRHRGQTVATLTDDVLGAKAELAVARFLGQTWLAYRSDAVVPADVGSCVQVRATTRVDGHLIIHRADPAHHAYVLARVDGEHVELLGWEWGYAMKRPEYLARPQFGRAPCYFVVADLLRPVETLPDVLALAA